MGNDVTSNITTPEVPPNPKQGGDTITAEDFRKMIAVLDQLRNHSHTYTDDYTTNCQCNCSRGSL